MEQNLLRALHPTNIQVTSDQIVDMMFAVIMWAHHYKVNHVLFEHLVREYEKAVAFQGALQMIAPVMEHMRANGHEPAILTAKIQDEIVPMFQGFKDFFYKEFDKIIQCPREGDTKN